MVFATARRITRDASLAEDVTQETFLELARKGRSVTESVGAWLHRVAWRRACDVVRAEVTRQRYEAAASAVSEGRECTWEELEPVFDEALAELPSDEREVIIEHYLEGRTQTEIAQRLGISQSSVSRLLEQSLDHLRARLKNKGVRCGAALGSMMSAASSEAASATLHASLQKIALSSIGSGAAGATGGMVLATLLGLAVKPIAVTALLLLAACVVGYDLASKESRIAGWLDSKSQTIVEISSESASAPPPPRTLAPPLAKARLLADAKAIWAKSQRLSQADRERLWYPIFLETNIEKRYATMRAVGFMLSRTEYDRVVARFPNAQFMGGRQTRNGRPELLHELMNAWYRESPLEAVAWTNANGAIAGGCFPLIVAPWIRSHAEEWAAFVEAGAKSGLGDYSRLWIEDMDDPGSIWVKAKAAGLSVEAISADVFSLIRSGAPTDQVFRLIMRCPDADERSQRILGVAPRLSIDQLRQAANSGLFTDTGVVAILRAMAGDASVSFSDLSAWVTKAANGGGMKAQLARDTEGCMGRFYAQWIKVDPQAALRHAGQAINQLLLDRFMEEGARSSAINETVIAEAFTSPTHRDRALAAYYQAKADDDPQIAMQSIVNSSLVNDQIESSKQVLTDWATRSPREAVAWATSLPEGEDRTELLDTVVTSWVEGDPEAAFAFAQSQGLPPTGQWIRMLPFGARNLPENKIAPILTALSEEPDYNLWMVRLARFRFPNQPSDAIAFMSKYGREGWQTAVVADVIDWRGIDGAPSDDFALQLPVIDLSNVDPQLMATAAVWFVESLASKGRLTTALDWTLKLPPASAPLARAQALSKVDLSIPKRRVAVDQWIRRAAISESERASLSQQVSDRAQLSAGTR